MAEFDEPLDDREADWYLDLEHNEGAARSLDPDLRAKFIGFLRPRAERQRLEIQAGDRQRPLREPTVADVSLDRRIVLRGSDVRISWEGLTPRSARVTVIGPDRNEQVVNGGNSTAVRTTMSGPIILRLRNERGDRARISDVFAGQVEVFALPEFRIPTGVLPPVPRAVLPRVQVPAHVSAALSVPIPRLSVGSVASLQRQTWDSAPRTVGAATEVARRLRVATAASRGPLDALRAALLGRPGRVPRH